MDNAPALSPAERVEYLYYADVTFYLRLSSEKLALQHEYELNVRRDVLLYSATNSLPALDFQTFHIRVSAPRLPTNVQLRDLRAQICIKPYRDGPLIPFADLGQLAKAVTFKALQRRKNVWFQHGLVDFESNQVPRDVTLTEGKSVWPILEPTLQRIKCKRSYDQLNENVTKWIPAKRQRLLDELQALQKEEGDVRVALRDHTFTHASPEEQELCKLACRED